MLRVSAVLCDKKQARDFMRAAAAKEGDAIGVEEGDDVGAAGATVNGARSVGSSAEAALAAAAEDGRSMEDVIAEAMEAIKISLDSAAKERREHRGRTDALGAGFGDGFGSGIASSPSASPRGTGMGSGTGIGRSPRSPASPGGGAATDRRDPSTKDATELRGELERLRRYALRLQQKREDAVRGALESENAAHRAREERDELTRVAGGGGRVG